MALGNNKERRKHNRDIKTKRNHKRLKKVTFEEKTISYFIPFLPFFFLTLSSNLVHAKINKYGRGH